MNNVLGQPERTQAVKDSKDKPLVTVITHKSASPKQLHEWSKTFKHPRDEGIRVVQFPSETNNIIRSVEEKPGLCHNCGISGHWQRDCWKRKCDSMRSGQEKQGPSKGKWNQGNSPNDTMLVLKFKNLSPSQQQSLLDALEVMRIYRLMLQQYPLTVPEMIKDPW